MARRTKEIKIKDRENEYTFTITEMSATKLESWIIRALLLIASSGQDDIPGGSDIKEAGSFLADKGLAALGGVDYDKAKPLLDEMLACCSRRIDNIVEVCTPDIVDGYIEDVSTLLKLRIEAVKFNLGFLSAGAANLSDSLAKPNTTTP